MSNVQYIYIYYLNILIMKIINLSDKNLSEFPTDVFENDDLEELYLDGNYIREIPEKICELKNLKILSAKSNFISKIPNNMHKLKNLKYLFLTANEIKFLPSCIGRLEKLHISYSNNDIHKIAINTANILFEDDEQKYIDDDFCIPEEIQEKIFNIIDKTNAIINFNYIEIDMNYYFDIDSKKIILKYCNEKKMYNNKNYRLNIMFYEIFQILLHEIKEKEKIKEKNILQLLNNKIKTFDNINHTERLLSIIELFE
jgi:Leucine-rich repeat (LRR) protein